jgi:vacuolar-type H+-ATPase subunit I/STV1
MNELEIRNLIKKWRRWLTEADMEEAIPEMELYVKENLYDLTYGEADQKLREKYYMAIPEEERWISPQFEELKFLRKRVKELEKRLKETEKAETIAKLEEELRKANERIKKLEEELEKTSEELRRALEAKTEAPPQEYVWVHVKVDEIPEFTGSDGKYYRPLFKHDIVKIPRPEYEKFLEREWVEPTVLRPKELEKIWEEVKKILRGAGIRKTEIYKDEILTRLNYQVGYEDNLAIAKGEAEKIVRAYAAKPPPEKVPPPKVTPEIERIIREELRRAFAPPPWIPPAPKSWEELEEDAARYWGEEGRKIVREYRKKIEKKEGS